MSERRQKTRIQIHLVHGDIGAAGEPAGPVPAKHLAPIDAIAVGHYAGVVPVDAELAVDKAISRALYGSNRRRLIISELSRRNAIAGDTARPFLMPDPRCPERVIAICGMGYASQFNVPELTALARELVWLLGSIGKKHLATVLIGSGNGNLPVDRAVDGWLRGATSALRDSEGQVGAVKAITFVEFSAAKLLQIHEALQLQAKAMGSEGVEYKPPAPAAIERIARVMSRREKPRNPDFPRQLIVDKVGSELRLGAITEDATVSECRVRFDLRQADEEAEGVIGAESRGEQVKLGMAFLQRLVPSELSHALMPNTPLVLICDHGAAQIPWEMMALQSVAGRTGAPVSPEDSFLGLSRGLTRQIKLRGGQQPGPVGRAGTVLRALVIADPARDKPLPNARREGKMLVQLFERFNAEVGARCRIEPEFLIGPEDAGGPDFVRQRLQSQPFDILHFAGHCTYSARGWADSGWVFSRNELFTAEHLRTIDRAPSLVVSNACDSGRMPSRSRDLRKMDPSFAEAFFVGRVPNFVCAAWQISDSAARAFAQAFYEHLLGVRLEPRHRTSPEPVHLAMQSGRLAAFRARDGLSSWGAYQHYGNPYFRLRDR